MLCSLLGLILRTLIRTEWRGQTCEFPTVLLRNPCPFPACRIALFEYNRALDAFLRYEEDKMLAAVLHDFDDLRLEEVPIPEPGLGEVVVDIRSCGICATDYKAIKGIRRNVTFPFIPGHEPSGVVARVGPGVIHFKEGDEVICQPSGYCGYCKHCRVGNTHYCEHAFTTGGDGPEDVWPGAFAECVRARTRSLESRQASRSTRRA